MRVIPSSTPIALKHCNPFCGDQPTPAPMEPPAPADSMPEMRGTPFRSPERGSSRQAGDRLFRGLLCPFRLRPGLTFQVRSHARG